MHTCRMQAREEASLEHAHRTAAAMAHICLKQGNQGARSPKEAKEFQDRKTANTPYRASPPVNQGLSSHSLSQASTFPPNDWVAPQLGLPEQSSTGRVKLNRCLYIKATTEKLIWGDSAAARLRGTHPTRQPILPQTQLPRCLLGLGARTYTQAEGSKLRREPHEGEVRLYSTLQEVQRQVPIWLSELPRGGRSEARSCGGRRFH